MKVLDLMQQLQALIKRDPTLQYIDVRASDDTPVCELEVSTPLGQEAPVLYIIEDGEADEVVDAEDWCDV